MKRYPKRARQAWGQRRPQPRPAPRTILGYSVSGRGLDGQRVSEWLDHSDAPVTTSKAFAGDVQIAIVLEPRASKRIPITISFGDNATIIHADSPGGSVADLARALAPLAHGGPIVAYAVDEAKRAEEEAAKRGIVERMLRLEAGALRDEQDMRRALAGGSFPREKR